MDLGTSFGRAEIWTAPGFADLRVGVLRLGLYGNDDARRGTSFELATWETLGHPDDLEHPRDLGDASAVSALTLRRQVDRDGWGAYVAADLVTRWFGHTRFATPRLGVRVGRFDRLATVVEARLPGAYLVGLGDGDRRRIAEGGDVDVGVRTTWVVSRRVRLESRGRYRDLAGADGRRLRDVVGAVGIELEASPPGPASVRPVGRPAPPNTWRVLTLFAGIGVRRALVDVGADEAGGGGAERPVSGGAPPGPWQVMAWVDLDVAMSSSLTIW
jgi:hypothetical protein